MKKIDLLQIDLDAGKNWMARVQEENHKHRVEEIRRKCQRQRMKARGWTDEDIARTMGKEKGGPQAAS